MHPPPVPPRAVVPRSIAASVAVFAAHVAELVPSAAPAAAAVLTARTTAQMIDRLYHSVVLRYLAPRTDDENVHYARVLWFRFVSVLSSSSYRRTAASRAEAR